MPTIHVSSFQPFESRVGRDTVLAIQFPYNAEVVEVLKAALRDAGRRFGRRNLGGWLADHHVWFCERAAWPLVRERLAGMGCSFHGTEGGAGRQERRTYSPPSTDWRPIFRQWFAGLARDYHPDRTLDDGKAMKIVNDAADRLRHLLDNP
jgi:hypothetical protein